MLIISSFIIGFIFLAVIFLCCFIFFSYIWPIKTKKEKWSIGIYAGTSPLELNPPAQWINPVLTAGDIKGMDAQFIADPFLIKEGAGWYLFFEVFNNLTQKGEIGFAASENGFEWNFQQIILSEPFHLSYPHVFRWENGYYMIPESYEAGSIRLYKAVEFPLKWEYERTLLEKVAVDASIFFHTNRWWMFTSNPHHNNQLNLYFAKELYGPWTEHPKNPLIRNNKHIARPGGRVTFFDGKIIRFAQDDWFIYGNKVRAFEIIKLSETDYQEKLVPKELTVSRTGFGWNRSGMHHVDPLQVDTNLWIAAVDGLGAIGKPRHIPR